MQKPPIPIQLDGQPYNQMLFVPGGETELGKEGGDGSYFKANSLTQLRLSDFYMGK